MKSLVLPLTLLVLCGWLSTPAGQRQYASFHHTIITTVQGLRATQEGLNEFGVQMRQLREQGGLSGLLDQAGRP